MSDDQARVNAAEIERLEQAVLDITADLKRPMWGPGATVERQSLHLERREIRAKIAELRARLETGLEITQ